MRVAMFTMVVLLTAPLALAEPTPKDDLIEAAKKLGETANYSWTTTVGSEGRRPRIGQTDGRIAEGVTHLIMMRGDNTYEGAFRGDRGIIKTEQGWRFLADAASRAGGGDRRADPTAAIARMLLTFRTPAVDAQELAGKAKELTKSGDTFTAELAEESARTLLPVGGRRGGSGPSVTDARGKVTFFTKEGVLVRYEYTVQGTVEANGKRRLIEQTTTTSVKGIGSTRLDLPAEAKLKIP